MHENQRRMHRLQLRREGFLTQGVASGCLCNQTALAGTSRQGHSIRVASELRRPCALRLADRPTAPARGGNDIDDIARKIEEDDKHKTKNAGRHILCWKGPLDSVASLSATGFVPGSHQALGPPLRIRPGPERKRPEQAMRAVSTRSSGQF